jgi:DNA-directed RNA polymerase specialized sigma24 family protein
MGRTTQAAGSVSARPDGGLTAVWDRHGDSAYALACALLGNEAAAAEAVRRAVDDLAASIAGLSPEQARRSLVRQVYCYAQVPAREAVGEAGLPPMIAWVSTLARLQRGSIALCAFGGLTHREAAALLDVPPGTVAALLAAGLRELGRRTAAATATCA